MPNGTIYLHIPYLPLNPAPPFFPFELFVQGRFFIDEQVSDAIFFGWWSSPSMVIFCRLPNMRFPHQGGNGK
jgi:hypothetical protein